MSNRVLGGIGAFFVMAGVMASPAMASLDVRVDGQIRPTGGELERWERIAWEYYFGNTNGNVFRRSRQASPDRNPFRSSRHYEQRLRASRDGYPLRTFVNAPTETPDGFHLDRGDSFAWPRGPRERNRWAFVPAIPPTSEDDRGWDDDDYDDYDYGDYDYDDYGDAEPVAPVRKPRPRQPWEIEMVEVHVATRAASQRAVARTVRDAEGRTRIIIESVPIPVADEGAALPPADGWSALGEGHTVEALAAFARTRLLDEAGAVDADFGTALTLVLSGDVTVGAAALRRILAAEPDLVSQMGARLDDTRRAVLERVDARLLDDTSPDALALRGVVRAVLAASRPY